MVVVTRADLEHDNTATTVTAPGRPPLPIASLAQAPGLAPRPRLLRAGPRELRCALLLPGDAGTGTGAGGRLPVLLDPYGGPHHRQVLAARDRFLVSQWFADQGFAVLVTDGRGTPGRGPAWERAVWRDLAGPVLDDQVEALAAVAADHPELDLHRVAIRGWSFGGYLAALAVLRRPDVFHAAVAGAPVTDWRLYDTHYTERYLGHPAADPDAYRRSSLLADAAKLERPLLLIHGLADDNVVAAHTLRLSEPPAGRRPPPQRPAPVRRHPPGRPGGGRREPPPPPARLPPRRPRPQLILRRTRVKRRARPAGGAGGGGPHGPRRWGRRAGCRPRPRGGRPGARGPGRRGRTG